ncbi:MAG: Txe/YoeB family addiction module toxin [Alphaproteobacteria bacterium]|nr:Txe/YoeB family addiction module toxin [Alphaproteobacteria bacterium]
MKIIWATQALNDYRHFQNFEPALAEKISTLIEDIRRKPFTGPGRPEPLRGDISGFWSRRITSRHRLVYRVSGRGADRRLEIAQCRFHY